jgi:hypothetical protein
MGLTLWLASGLVAWSIARIIPPAREKRPSKQWVGELAVALGAALFFGLAATYLDFGGWQELDWRAGLLAFFGAFAAAGVFRLVTFSRRRPLQ